MINGVDLIKKFEGFRSNAYPDPGTHGKPYTIGYGTTVYPNGTPVKKGDTITKAKAEAYLIDYLNKNVRPKLVGLRLKPGQQAAIESIVYNVGTGFFRSNCFAGIKEKDWGKVYNNWDWIKGGGKVLPGLIKRRSEELYLFFQDL